LLTAMPIHKISVGVSNNEDFFELVHHTTTVNGISRNMKENK